MSTERGRSIDMTTTPASHNRLLWAILAGAVGGILCGWFFGESMKGIGWIGQMFLDALKMTIIPLIAAAVISSITSVGDVGKLGRLGGVVLCYYLMTTAIAVSIGLVLVNLIQPGTGVEVLGSGAAAQLMQGPPPGFQDIIRSMITPNLVAAAADMQLLPLIVFCLLFSTALMAAGPTARPVGDFFEGLNEIMMKLVMWIMYVSPIGIFALIASTLGRAGGPAFMAELTAIGLYVVTVLLGLALHFCVLLTLLFVLGRRGREYLITMLRALVTAFGTASSSATMPLTIRCAVEAGVDKRAARFIIPLGATINMDGTALYQAVAAMFIAQAYGIELGLGQQMLIFVTATLASIGAAGIPQAGLVTMLIVFNAVGLPAEGIGLILAVDWFLDRFRTTVNVWGDSVGAAVVERLALEPHVQSAIEAADEVA
jgi:Na+/H+-dicarboxylate symporter